MEGRYDPVPIETLEDGALQGYNAMLDLFIRWEHGDPRWHDPAIGQHIVTYSDLLDQAESNRVLAANERARANAEQEARMAAEAHKRGVEPDTGYTLAFSLVHHPQTWDYPLIPICQGKTLDPPPADAGLTL